MDWFYAHNSQQAGPIPEAQLDAMLNAGTITQDTLVWRAGMTAWQPLRAAGREFLDSLPEWTGPR